MKAGRELDALIAEKVMGWTYDEVLGWNSPDGKLTGQPCPRAYSTDIAAAWAVVVKFTGVARVEFHQAEGWWIELGNGYDSASATAPTAPLAICLAALKTVR